MIKATIMEDEGLEVLRMEVGPFGNTVYLVRDRLRECCALIDAAAEGDSIVEVIGEDRLVAILQTHTHLDHIQALEVVRNRSGAPVCIHPLEPEAARLQPDILLGDDQRIVVGAHELEVLHTPGHTPGSVCFLLRPDICFCGDTVFPGGPGKTSSPDAFRRIIQSLERKIYTLADNVRLLPGHGDGISVGDSRREYQAFCNRPREKTPYGDVLWEET
jgi:glyoxylase-like metal-dependent hydrolase (beta-lactamase superfamily II)